MAVVAIIKEQAPFETRVAATPDTVKKLIALGLSVTVEAGAGIQASIPDGEYEAAGALVVAGREAALAQGDLILKVRAPAPEESAAMKAGATLVGLLNPFMERPALDALAARGVTAFTMEFVPRITRAQVMDALSSQANLAGYRAVIEAAGAFGRAMPMMMTAAGAIAPAKVFVMGAGVAGLQAIATARRLGGVVTATDVRPAAKEQVESLGAKFIAVEDEEFKAAETAAGYAKPMSPEYQAKQAALVSEHIKKQDIVITTALIPGRPAPRLVSEAQVLSMKPGSILIDLAVEQGGNVEGSRPAENVAVGGATIVGIANLPGRIAADSSALYARNLLAFVGLLVDKDGQIAPDMNDEILSSALVARDGGGLSPFPAAVRLKTGEKETPMEAVDPTLFRLAIFVLAVFVGYYVVWSVTPALHTPLMAVTNAISSVIVVGALLAAAAHGSGGGSVWVSKGAGALAAALASVNIFGGFLVTQRMLAMYRKKDRPGTKGG